MIKLKSPEEIKILREGGRHLGTILAEIADQVVPGVSLVDLDTLARELFTKVDGEPAFLGYTPTGATRPYPAAICVSVNEEIVHGIPNEDPREIKEGDLVSIDAGLKYQDLFTDHAVTVRVGQVTKEVDRLVSSTKEALLNGIAAAKAGNRVVDISQAIEAVAKRDDLSIFAELVGHGVGYSVHEPPTIPNVTSYGEGPLLEPGLVIAIEPMFGLGEGKIRLTDDDYTYITTDGSLSAHFEHTVAITEDGPEILTQPQHNKG